MASWPRSTALAVLASLGAGRAAAAGPAGDQPVDPYGPAAPAAPAPPAPTPASPAPASPPPAADDDVRDQVAEALYQRGLELFQQGDAQHAKSLFVESLEESEHGTSSADALRMLRAANQKLGLSNLDDGRPGTGSPGPIDPYASAPRAEAPIDPYGGAAPAAPAPAEGGATTTDLLGRPAVIGWSGAVGLIAGMSLAGPEDSNGNIGGGPVAAGLIGAGVGVAASWWLTGRYPLDRGQSSAVISGATWGALDVGLLGDAFTGTDSDPNDIWKYVGAGGLLGLGGGLLYGVKLDPPEGDVAFVNSLGFYGTSAGLLLGVAMDPPHGEAYSLNAVFGSAAGIATGLFLVDRGVHTTRRRMLLVDLGAVLGAGVAWGFYPLVRDNGTRHDEQWIGFLSTLTMGGGAVGAWLLSRGYDEPEGQGDEAASVAARNPAPPALAPADPGLRRRRRGSGGPRPGPRPRLRPVLGGLRPIFFPGAGFLLRVNRLRRVSVFTTCGGVSGARGGCTRTRRSVRSTGRASRPRIRRSRPPPTRTPAWSCSASSASRRWSAAAPPASSTAPGRPAWKGRSR
jgi:hypothetical protein